MNDILFSHVHHHVVFSKDCNPMGTIYGGKLIDIMDMTVFQHTLQLLPDTPCDDAVTVNFTGVDFLASAVEGDLLKSTSYLDKIGVKSLRFFIEVETVEKTPMLISTGYCTFVTRQFGRATPHGLPRWRRRESERLKSQCL